MNLSQFSLRLIPFCFLLLISLTAFSQDTYERRLSVSEWIEEMVNCKDTMYLLENAEIFIDEDRDTSYYLSEANYLPEAKPLWSVLDSLPETNIYAIVRIWDCKFPEKHDIILRNLVFHENVNIAKSNIKTDMYFENCRFKKGIFMKESDIHGIEFKKCHFDYTVALSDINITMLEFGNCTFTAKYQKAVKSLDFGVGTNTGENNFQFVLRLWQMDGRINLFYMHDSKVIKEKKTPVISFLFGKYGLMQIDNNDFNDAIVDFGLLPTIEDAFVFYDCIMNKPLGVGLNFPIYNTMIQGTQLINNGIALYNWWDYDEPPYTAQSDTQLADKGSYKALISAYNKFFNSFKTRGDKEFANATYIAMKDIETRRLKYLYEQNKTIDSWFNWRLNQFLQYFCEYGTSPVRSLIISMYVIIAFAFFYFFFYSDWDRINRTFFVRQYRKTVKYFRSEQKLEDFYSEEHKEEFQSYEEFKKEIEESKIEIPFFLSTLGKPLYHLSLVRHRIMTWLYRRTEILSGRWTDLKPTRKIFVGTTVGLAITIYLINLGIIRALNSIMLSINTFSTLGFGDIPVKGVTRYVAILEGFLGWFLLSIFSVSLISQILQN